jgi:hypothetical protein
MPAHIAHNAAAFHGGSNLDLVEKPLLHAQAEQLQELQTQTDCVGIAVCLLHHPQYLSNVRPVCGNEQFPTRHESAHQGP